MKIMTWNVNSVRTRLERLLAVLQRHGPDVLCLQELKCTEDQFPFEPIEQAGYQVEVLGQKTYNGVAILSRGALSNVQFGWEYGQDDSQSRLIAATVEGVRIYSVYVPNGGTVGSEKWDYKLAWLKRLKAHLTREPAWNRELVLCGDLNIARDDLDVANPEQWSETVLCHPEARAALADLLDLGLVDVFRSRHPQGKIYSWWDYRRLGFPKNDGIRLDYLLASQNLAEGCVAAEVDREERKGRQPSDHAPVWADFQ